MEVLNKIKSIATSGKMLVVGGAAFALGSVSAFATPLIANDTLEGLGAAGTSLGDFMGNLAPGLFKFLLLMGLAVAIVGVVVAIIAKVKSKGIGGVR